MENSCNSHAKAVLGGLGNTKPNPQEPCRKHHFLTLNNYDEFDIVAILSYFDEFAYSYVMQEEIGESGTPHLQGVFSLKKEARWTSFGLMKSCHWEACAKVSASFRYCSDIEKRAPSGLIWAKKFDNYIKTNKYEFTEWKPWQAKVLEIVQQTPDDRTINWFWETTGNVGKSFLTKYLIIHKGAALFNKGKYSDIMNLIFKEKMRKIVIFDLPRNNGNKISYSAMESLKDGLICNTKYETGFKVIDPLHIIVFANSPPDTEKMSADRWNIVEIMP